MKRTTTTTRQIQTRKKSKKDVRLIKNIKRKYNDDQSSSFQYLTLVNLPDLVIEKILGFLSFHEIAKARMVCRTFNKVCWRLLNRGYISVQNYYKECHKKMYEQFPKELFVPCFCPVYYKRELLHIIDVSFFFFDITYLLSIKSYRCCFIPGKILDEIYNSLYILNNHYKSLSTMYCCTELFLILVDENKAIKDISLMAVNHFLSKIFPIHKKSWTIPNILVSQLNSKPFETIIARSFTGNLTTQSLNMESCMYTYLKEYENQLKYVRDQFQKARIKETQLNGLGRDLEPEKLIMAISPNLQDIEYFLLKWKDMDEAEFFNYEEVEEYFPDLLKIFVNKKRKDREFADFIRSEGYENFLTDL